MKIFTIPVDCRTIRKNEICQLKEKTHTHLVLKTDRKERLREKS